MNGKRKIEREKRRKKYLKINKIMFGLKESPEKSLKKKMMFSLNTENRLLKSLNLKCGSLCLLSTEV